MAEVSWRIARPEACGSTLIGSRIRIWWDGDRTFYEGNVVGYDGKIAKHKVIYYGEDTDVYIEDLESGSQQWELAVPIEKRNHPCKSTKADNSNPTHSSSSGGTAGRKSTYVDMALEAVTFLNESNGVSLSSIRKWILSKYPETKEKQKASFNSLTIKGLMKLVSEGTLEKVKHSFRLSLKCAAERKTPAQHEEISREGNASSLQQQAKGEGKACRRRRAASGAGRRPVRTGKVEKDSCEPDKSSSTRNQCKGNTRMHEVFEERMRRRNDFLSQRRALLLPFMQDGDNFVTRMDRALATEKESRELTDAEAKAEAKVRELEASKHAEAKRQGDVVGVRSPSGPAPLLPPPLPPPPREVNPVDEVEFKAIPADPMTVAETLVKMGVLKREDIAPGAAKVALTGQRCTEWPPLQVDRLSGVPTMEDRDTLGARIEEEGPFLKYFIAWPGNRLPVDDLREANVDVDYSHIYYLEKREFVAPPPMPVPTLGPHGWVYPPQPPPPAVRIIGRTTAMRLRSGVFVPHRVAFMKKTQAYAKRNNVPVDNLVTFSIINPHTHRRYNVTREFCAAPCYASIYKRLLRDTLYKNPYLISVLAGQAPRAVRLVETPATDIPPRTAAKMTVTSSGGERDARRKEAGMVPAVVSRAPASGGFAPAQSHPLPRGPGGIDIFSDPPVTSDPPPSLKGSKDRGGSDQSREGLGDEADAAAVAAAAMLGLGACASSSGRGTGEQTSRVSGAAPTHWSGERRSSELSNGHSEKMTGRDREQQGQIEEGACHGHRMENGALEHGGAIGCRDSPSPPLSPDSKERAQLAAEEWHCKARSTLPEGVKGAMTEAMHWQALQSEASRLPVDPTLFRTIEKRLDHALSRASRESRREREGGKHYSELRCQEAGWRGRGKREDFVKREAVKQEGTEVEEPLSRRKAGRAASKALAESECLDVLKGVPTVPVPESIKAKLHDHQRDGLRWMANMYHNGMPMILGDEMGLGKTLQVIAFVAHLRDKLGACGPYLIVVPLSALGSWMSDIDKFFPSLRAVRFHGPQEELNRIKEEEMKEESEFDVVVTTYEMLTVEAGFFKLRFLWQLVIVDEGHRLKNDKSQLSQELKQVTAICRVLLTDIPLQHNLHELWALLHFLVPDVFGLATAERFKQGFDLKGTYNPRRKEQADELLSLFMLQRVKDQVQIDLPPKQEVEILVKLSPAQHMMYKHLLVNQDRPTLDAIMAEAQRHGRVVKDGSGRSSSRSDGEQDDVSMRMAGRVSSVEGCLKRGGEAATKSVDAKDTDYRKLMNLLLQLRKVCNHPYLLLDVEPTARESEEQALEKMIASSGKLTLLDRMLPKLQERGHRCLIFSQFTSMLDILEEYCAGRGYEHARLDGGTSPVQRRLDIRRFNAPLSKVFVFLVSTRAGGLDINLSSADTVIFYDSDWNPQVDLQAIERAHQIGQTEPVKIYRLVCRGSVEERMHPYGNDSEDSEGSGHEDAGDEEWQQALSIGGLSNSMSKEELASLIHQGARAILQGQEEGDLTEQELESVVGAPATSAPSTRVSHTFPTKMREGWGTSPSATGSSSPSAAAVAAAAGGQGTLSRGVSQGMDRGVGLRGLQVDLMQLDGVTCARANRKPPVGGVLGGMLHGLEGARLQLGEKRAMKNRVVMDSDTPDIRGRLAELAKTMTDVRRKKQAKGVDEDGKQRGETWRNMKICMLCGKGKTRSRTLVSCGLCPRSFHLDCLDEDTGVKPSGSATFVCSQHRCVGCTRATAAAGGLLFRCQTCVNAFCEDCLPEDEVEPLGRNRQLEALGYLGKQSYWIRCDACLEGECQFQVDEVKADGDRGRPDQSRGSKGGDVGETEMGNERALSRGAGIDEARGGQKKRNRVENDYDDDEDNEDDEDDSEEEEEPMSFAVALTLLQDHPAAEAAFLKPRDEMAASGSTSLGKRSRVSSACSVELIASKVQAGRYRSAVAFESDARQLLTQGRGPRSISAEQKQLVEYFEQEILPRLRRS